MFTGLAVADYKKSLANGRIEYDGAAAGDCIAALANATCAQYSSGEQSLVEAGCRPFIIPKLAEGAACGENYECLTGNCDGETNDTDGTCTTLPGEGQACSTECADELSCNYDSSTGMQICEAPKADGAECSLDRECASDDCDDTTRMCTSAAPTCDGR